MNAVERGVLTIQLRASKRRDATLFLNIGTITPIGPNSAHHPVAPLYPIPPHCPYCATVPGEGGAWVVAGGADVGAGALVLGLLGG